MFKTLVIQTPDVQNFSYTNAACATFYLYGHVKKGLTEKCKLKRRREYSIEVMTSSITQELNQKRKRKIRRVKS